ncbi:MAG: beta-lactamase domain protein [Verrucomicrobiaceae bacterium]|nr:beta-lactamase domain protein [Verrucomicrobiaceae bacterium]
MSTKNSFSLNPYFVVRRLALAVAAISAVAVISACSRDGDALHASAKTLSVTELKSIEFSGSGHWYQFGQAPSPTSAWPQFDVSNYTATINYENPAAHVQITRLQTIEAGRVRPAPVEQKPDQYVSGALAWNLAPPAGAPAGTAPTAQIQPAAVDERITEIWTTPQGFIKAALANNATQKSIEGGGATIEFNVGKIHYEGSVNAKNKIDQVKTWIDTPVLGDTLIEYTYSDYKDFGGVSFPAHILRKQGGYPVLDLNVAAVKANVGADIPVPAEISQAEAPKVVVASEELAPGVFYLRGGTHHSLVIDQQDHIVVVEAPLNEERSAAVIAKAKELIPGKPITYLINTHQHFDHSGGLRTYVDEGATIVTHELNKPYYEKIWAAPRTINPDRLAASKRPAKFETFTDKYVLKDAARPIEVHQIAGSGHDDAFALVYLPAQKILSEADAYTPLAANAPRPASVNPYSVNLYDNIRRLKLDVNQIAALHGPGVVKLADLQEAIGEKTASN